MERLLRRALPDAMSPLSAACIDAETVAAWAEGALSRSEASRVESHLAGCARCQGMAAVLARTEPAPAAPATAWWRQVPMRWAAPLTAAAAAVLIWAVLPGDEPPAEMQNARAEPAQIARPAAPEPDLAAPADAASAATPAATAEEETRAAEAQPARRDDAPGESAAASERPQPAAEPSPAPAATPPASAMPRQSPSAPPPAREEASGSDRASFAVTETLSVAEAAPFLVESPGDPAMRSSPAAQARPALAGRAIAADAQATARTQWRVWPAGRVERSADEGATWTSVPLEPPVGLTAGSAPSPLVCWLVGPSGAVLRTTDGRRFERVPFPEAVDLVSVEARDAGSAAVTTADGRVLTTTDGGATWR
jgi:hypothetical protein